MSYAVRPCSLTRALCPILVAALCAGAFGDDRMLEAAPPVPFLKVRVQPGHFYEFVLPKDDGIPGGTRWAGNPLVRAKDQEGGSEPIPGNPMHPMYGKRFIIKADDLATWSLGGFKRFASLIEKHDAKAGFGIVPGTCDDEVFAWVRTLDLDRFEIWNHTWTHGKDGPNHYEQPYDVQWRNLELAHRKVLEETDITMHSWCGGGIRYKGGVHDQDDVTHWVVRNHPDYKVHFHANPKFADCGLGRINADGIFMPWRYSWFENESFSDKLVETLKDRWPDVDWNRPSARGNAEELKWRFDHPFWHMPESGEIENMVAQFHPASYTEEEFEAVGALLEYIKSQKNWCYANAYETYKWLMDREDVILEKTGPAEYRLDAKAVRFEHILELDFPRDTTVSESTYRVGAFDLR